MNSSKFNIRVGIHAVLLAITSAAFVWTLSKDYLLVTRFSLGILWIVQIILLIYYVNKTNRDLLLFLQSFEFKDDTLTFNKKRDLPFKPIYDEFNRIIDNFRRIKLEKEMDQQFFQYSVKHVDTGLISFDATGTIGLLNDAAKRLLQLEYAKHISALDRVKKGLSKQCEDLIPGKQELVKVIQKDQVLSLSIRAAEFKLQENPVKLISFQNIKNELDQQELDSWQKLIRVLTHEIINSVSPITLLSSTLVKMFGENGVAIKPSQIDDQQVENAFSGLQAINKRSKGLSRFVESYKSLTKIPEPVIAEVPISDLFARLKILLDQHSEVMSTNVSYKVDPSDLKVLADERLLEQVLINLIKNAREAAENQERVNISVAAREEQEGVCIQVEDDGPGIAPEVLENIFVPFYTTKKEGSGIGLSLSRQIIRKHGGSMEVVTKQGKGTTFTITL